MLHEEMEEHAEGHWEVLKKINKKPESRLNRLQRNRKIKINWSRPSNVDIMKMCQSVSNCADIKGQNYGIRSLDGMQH